MVRELLPRTPRASDQLLSALENEAFGAEARKALAEFDAAGCPGVPTFVAEGERFFGKDRVDWLLQSCRQRATK
jgi:2-hydroxychromene-2-carboxylate isomerase